MHLPLATTVVEIDLAVVAVADLLPLPPATEMLDVDAADLEAVVVAVATTTATAPKKVAQELKAAVAVGLVRSRKRVVLLAVTTQVSAEAV